MYEISSILYVLLKVHKNLGCGRRLLVAFSKARESDDALLHRGKSVPASGAARGLLPGLPRLRALRGGGPSHAGLGQRHAAAPPPAPPPPRCSRRRPGILPPQRRAALKTASPRPHRHPDVARFLWPQGRTGQQGQ